MTTVLVFSDSHGRISAMENVVVSVPHNGIIFLGDMENDIRTLAAHYPEERICKVTGNNDFLLDAPYERIYREENLKILCCHGHKYQVKQTLTPLFFAAAQKGCQAALFGHTHRQYAETAENGILLLNPGSIGFRGEYAVLRLANGVLDYTLCGDA